MYIKAVMWMLVKVKSTLATPESRRELPTYLTWDSRAPPILKSGSPRSSKLINPSGQQACLIV